MRHLVGVLFLFIALTIKLYGDLPMAQSLFFTLWLGGTGICLILPPPPTGTGGARPRLLQRAYIVGRMLVGVPLAIMGAVAIYLSFAGGPGVSAAPELGTQALTLAIGAMCLAAGAWICSTSVRAWS